MATRERRVSRPPLKYAAQDEYWEHGRRKDNRPARQVYRLLKQKDMRKDLLGQEVHVYWPEDQQWYRATVEEVTLQPEQTAYLHYPDTDEYEDVNLNELVESKQIAVIENRSVYAKLTRDEIPVNIADRLIPGLYEDEHVATEDGSEGASSDDDHDSGEPRMSREHHKQVQRGKRSREEFDDRAGNGHLPHAARTSSGGLTDVATTVDALAAGDSDMAEAEAFKNSIINALMHTFSGTPGAPSAMIPTPTAGMIPTPGSGSSGGHGHHPHAPMIMIPTPGGAGGDAPPSSGRGGRTERTGSGLRHQGSLPTASSTGNDDEVRSKVREQLVAALQRALEELKAEGYTETLPDPVAVAAEVEAELYKLHENSVSKDYKAKFRSLSFNLRDNANPELRARVLRGELAPAKLVTLGPAELARRELSEWRQRRQEEAAKMVFLDAETAAKFSTAAAAALAQKRIASKDEIAKPADTSPERAAQHGDASAATAASGAGHAAGEEGAPAATSTEEGAARRLSLTRMDSSTSGGGVAGGEVTPSGGSIPELVRRTSLQGTPSVPGTGDASAVAAAAAAASVAAAVPVPPPAAAVGPAGTLSPAKRAVLRAALPAAATAADETPPREDQGGDAPYDPGSYDEPYDPEQQMPDDAGPAEPDEDADMPTYTPFGTSSARSSVAAAVPKPSATSAPSVASLRAAPASLAPASGPEQQPSLPSPIRSPPAPVAVVADLAPVIQRQQPGEGPMGDVPLDNVGETLWAGLLRVPGSHPSEQVLVAVEVSYLGGSGRLGPMLRSAEPPTELLVKGQVKLSRVEQFFEELRRSRSRTITLALVRQLSPESAAAMGLSEAAVAAASAAAAGAGGMVEFVAQHRSRTGLATPQTPLEAYLVTRGGLAARLLKTARVVCPSHQLALLPEDIGDDQLLLAMVHPRTWEPPPHVTAFLSRPTHLGVHHPHPPAPAAGALPPPDLAGLPPLGPLPGPGGLPPPAADPRLRGAAPPPQGQQPPPPPTVIIMDALAAPPAGMPPAPQAPPAGGDAGGAGGLPIDLGALSDLAAALGIPGGGGGGPGQGAPSAPGPEALQPPPQPLPPQPQPQPEQQQQQLVTMVMQNPDGTLAIVAVPQSAAGAVVAAPPGGQLVGAPPPTVLLPPPGHGSAPPPSAGEHPGGYQQQPPPQMFQPPPPHHPGGPPPGGHPDHAPQLQYLPPGAPPGSAPPPGPYREAPPPEHYPPPGQPPPGRYGPPPPAGGPPQAPYGDPRSGPPPPHHHHQGYPPQQPPSQPDPYYNERPPPHSHSHPYHPPPGHGHEGGGPGGPPPPYGGEGRPPPYYHPHEGQDGGGGGGYEDPYYRRGGPPGPHDHHYRSGPGRGGRGPPPPREWSGGEHGGGRWGGRRGGGGWGRGGGPEDGRGGHGYEEYDGYGEGGGGGGGYRGRGRGGSGRDYRDWEGGRERRERGGYGRPEGHHTPR